MPRIIKDWWRPGRHYVPREGERGWRKWLHMEEVRKASEADTQPEPTEAVPEPESEPEVETEAEEVTVTGKVAGAVKMAASAPVKGAVAAGSIAVDATVAAASLPGKVAKAAANVVTGSKEDEEAGTSEGETDDEDPKPPTRNMMGRFRKKPKNPKKAKEAPPETLEPPLEPKTAGGILSGFECHFCGKTYRLERYFKPHLKKCHLNPDNVGRA